MRGVFAVLPGHTCFGAAIDARLCVCPSLAWNVHYGAALARYGSKWDLCTVLCRDVARPCLCRRRCPWVAACVRDLQ